MNHSAATVATAILLSSFAAHAQTLTKEKLDRVKRYIITAGGRCTYTSMYSDNPCLETPGFRLYLNPDPGPNGHPQWNIRCDTARGDFNTLVVQEKSGAPVFHAIEFLDPNAVTIRSEGKNPESILGSAVLDVLRRMASE